MTVRMIRTEDGKTGDIHPDEVEHMTAHGWQIDEPAPSAPQPASDCSSASRRSASSRRMKKTNIRKIMVSSPIAASMRSSSLPERPTNGRPSMSPTVPPISMMTTSTPPATLRIDALI